MSAHDERIPTVSRVLEDRSLVELIYDPEVRATSLAVCSPEGGVSIEKELILGSGERLIPYDAANTLLSNGCVLLPSTVGETMTPKALLERIRSFLYVYLDLPDTFAAIAAHYVLLTWVYDAFSDLPYLRFRGDFGTGKTRALLTIGSICYKPFFASGASTVSPIFHILDAFQGTLILDEADFRFSEATAPLTKLLNNGTTRGMPVLRTMTNRHRELNPQAFRVFGPKVVAMREQFSDLALESRFFTCETGGRPLRPDVPIYLPDTFHVEALELRNALLAWRFRSRFSAGPDPSRAAVGVSPRYRQTSLSLLSLIDDAVLRERVGRELAGYEARVLNERADSFEAAMLGAIEESFGASKSGHASIQDIATRFNAQVAEELGRPVSNKWVGTFVRQRLRLVTLRTGGVFVLPASERPKLATLCERYGVKRAA